MVRKPEDPEVRSQRRFNLQHRRKMSLVQELVDLYAEALRRQRSHDDILASRTTRIFKSEAWAKLSSYDHEFLMGVDHILMQQLWQQVVFSYEVEIGGMPCRIRQGTVTYKITPPRDINTNTGAFVYSTPPHRLFTTPKGSDEKSHIG